jgi:flavin-binding protein dodecin
MAVLKTIEIVGSSPHSSDDAVRAAVAEARRSLRGIAGVDVVSRGLRGEGVGEWRARVRVAFLVERPEPGQTRRSAAAEAAALKFEEREEL